MLANSVSPPDSGEHLGAEQADANAGISVLRAVDVPLDRHEQGHRHLVAFTSCLAGHTQSLPASCGVGVQLRGALGYATANPAVGAAKAKVVSEAPGILTVSEAARLLETATLDVLPYLAIGLFAGLRRAEIERLDWSEIDFESGLIEVKAAKSKTAQRRFVTIQPNLREWLLPLRQHKGNVIPQNRFRQSFEQARAPLASMTGRRTRCVTASRRIISRTSRTLPSPR